MRGRWPILLIALLAAAPVAAQTDTPIVVSKAADNIAVTFYRDGSRNPGSAMTFETDNFDEMLGGYAMIAETRTVTIPPGAVTVRFEGVASGIEPESAIMFNGDLKEKNFDGRLLSQRGLIDAFTGQRVTIRRTDPKTGEQVTESATILSEPDALVLKTSKGYETVGCSGGMDTLLFSGVPKDLTAKPTLSMLTRPDNPGGTMTITLAYLALNFDWQANYVGTFSPDGQSLHLNGWLTLAGKDNTTFLQAEVSAVAGQVARARWTDDEIDAWEEERKNDPYAKDNIDLGYTCWPLGKTATGQSWPVLFGPGSLPEKKSPIYVRYDGYGYYGGGCGDEEASCDEIVVTGSRIAHRDDLGDLKLYTLPFPSDVPSKQMKQVRFMKDTVLKGETLYRGSYQGGGRADDPKLVFRFDNKKSNGAGEPLPQGQIALFQHTRAGRQLIGETSIDDKAVDQEVAINLPNDDAYLRTNDEETDKKGDNWVEKKLTIENDEEWPVLVEIELSDDIDYDREYRLSHFGSGVKRRDGKYVWRVTIPAESEKTLKFRETEIERPVYESDE